jgi:hypothetical protein
LNHAWKNAKLHAVLFYLSTPSAIKFLEQHDPKFLVFCVLHPLSSSLPIYAIQRSAATVTPLLLQP